MFDNLVTTAFVADTALIFYKRTRTTNGFMPDGTYLDPTQAFIQRHPIKDGLIAEGQPLTRRQLVTLCSTVLPQIKEPVTLLPENLLAYSPGSGCMMWWAKAKDRSIFFHKEAGIKSGKAPMPAILFLVRRNTLYVWALKQSERPSPETVLYKSPFYNTDANGTCMGNVKTPDKTSLKDIAQWEKLFFGSYFTLHGDPQLRGITPKKLWKGLTASKYNAFPLRHLKPWGTVQKLITMINNNREGEG